MTETWKERLREAKYFSPSGQEFRFYYEDVSRETLKKTTAFEFPDSDNTLVQDLGHTSKRYPMRCIFWGKDHDKQASDFENGLNEKGIGKLEHPFYGDVDVVPFDLIARRDSLKSAANQSVISVTFFETIRLIYPNSQTDARNEVNDAINNTAATQAQESEDNIDNSLESNAELFKRKYNELLDNTKSSLEKIAEKTAAVQKQFDDISDSINRNIDVLIRDPATLAFQTNLLLQTPARSLTDIQARLGAYKELLGFVISGAPSSKNDFYMKNIFSTAIVSSTILAALNNQFVTKSTAIEFAADIVDIADQVENWKATYAPSPDTGETYQQLQQAVALSAGFLVQLSFTLKEERTIVLDRKRTIIDLCAELFGNIDDELDFFITSNSLSGSEILELPIGRRLVYYI